MGWFGGKKGDEERYSSSSRRSNSTPQQRSQAASQAATSQASSIPVSQARSPNAATMSRKELESQTTEQHDNDGLLVIDRPPREEKQYDEEASRSFSRGEEESADDAPSYTETARQNHLNSLFNGHLMKWKFEAEEGSAFVRVPAFFGALGLIATLVTAMVMEDDAFSSHAIVMGICDVIMAFFVLVLDGRFLSTNPLSTRAHLRNIITRNFNMFRFVWGRGILYILAGVLNIAQMWLVTMISGAYMVFVGLIAIIVGVHASRKFAALRNSLADESFLLLVFSNYDSDGDGYLAPNEFALLLSDLGMELDDRYTLKAFNVIDTDSDRRISFDEFNHWWASGYIERGRKRYNEDLDEDDTYRRME